MVILFSPSETKQTGGDQSFDISRLFGSQLGERERLLSRYEAFVEEASTDELELFFETADIAKREMFTTSLHLRPAMKAFLRYTGVAYDHLDYLSLREDDQRFLDDHTLIFSNLFGPIKGGDDICDYRFRQGAKISGIAWEKGYQRGFSPYIDHFCEGKIVVDLRAGFYEKFYKPSCKKVTYLFLKNGKAVSHWAKAYRGETLRLIALHRPKNIEELSSLEWQGVQRVDVQEKGDVTTIVVAI